MECYSCGKPWKLGKSKRVILYNLPYKFVEDTLDTTAVCFCPECSIPRCSCCSKQFIEPSMPNFAGTRAAHFITPANFICTDCYALQGGSVDIPDN